MIPETRSEALIRPSPKYPERASCLIFWVSALLIVAVVALSLVPGLFVSADPTFCELKHSFGDPASGYPFGFNCQGCDIYVQGLLEMAELPYCGNGSPPNIDSRSSEIVFLHPSLLIYVLVKKANSP